MEKRFVQPAPVLDARGRPNPGWASYGILEYNRKAIKAPFYRIKEWDWYQVNDATKALQFTYGHASYAGQIGVTLFDFGRKEKIFTKDVILPLPFGSLHLESSADDDGVLVYDKKGMYLRIENKGDTRTIACRCEGFDASVSMTRHNPNALVINVPFDEYPEAFYYNHKINCMVAEGEATVGDKTFTFDPKDSFGLLDWGRGVWPFHNEWYWSNATGRLNNRMFGFNLGRGFGNTAVASENAVFYGSAMHKIGEIDITLGDRYSDPWHLHDKEGRLDLTLEPVYDRETAIKLLWVNNSCHQMFGRFHGQITLDDGSKLDVQDITGFAEHAINNW
jgi:hypothetical protein